MYLNKFPGQKQPVMIRADKAMVQFSDNKQIVYADEDVLVFLKCDTVILEGVTQIDSTQSSKMLDFESCVSNILENKGNSKKSKLESKKRYFVLFNRFDKIQLTDMFA
mmetsp:Transcript_17040/g.19654  ORF Transcript_17040/g.19654 Transcript_17040/m.19654 type:complete len:108 (+) Transcript_17040:999-1322(+)